MNILREIRRIKSKNILVKIRILLLLLVMLIVSTYAWWSGADSTVKGLDLYTDSWDVKYVIKDQEILDEEYIMEIDKFYPGMEDNSKVVKIYNLGSATTVVEVELTSVKLFGEELLNDLSIKNGIEFSNDNKTVTLFKTDEYPFEIGYSQDKRFLQGRYTDDENSSAAKGQITFSIKWNYNNGNDSLDTTFGKRAYEWYKENEEDSAKALEVHVKIKSSSYSQYKKEQ